METRYRVYEVKRSYVGGWHEDVSLIAVSCVAVALWVDGTILEELLLSPSFGCSIMRMQRCALGRVEGSFDAQVIYSHLNPDRSATCLYKVLIVRCKDLKAQRLIGVSEIHGHTLQWDTTDCRYAPQRHPNEI